MSRTDPIPNALLRRLTADNRRMARQLAQVEIRAFLAELDNPGIFELDVDLPDRGDPRRVALPFDPDDPMARRLPRISVPLGKCSWAETPDELPVVGIHCPEMPDDLLRESLRNLVRSHHRQPFARPVFLCTTLRPIPLLGRFGFAYDYIGSFPLERLARRFEIRYGLSEVRDLLTARRLWPD